jgi:hypothetical protein
MSNPPRLESRIGALISAYADQAATAVDPMGMARLVAAGSPRHASSAFRFGWPVRSLAFLLLVVGLLAAMAAGALMAGRELSDGDSAEFIHERALVEPFTGLPPVGASPSVPETGEPVLRFVDRVTGRNILWIFLYADGRLIWTQDHGKGIVVEQYLSPFGVELLRAEIEAATIEVRPPLGTGLSEGFGLQIRRDGQMVDVTWADSRDLRRLVDPESWLPSAAWLDPRIGGYVPPRYAVCFEPSGGLAALPRATRELLADQVETGDPDDTDRWCRFEVPLDDARAIVTTLFEAGLPWESGVPARHSWLRFTVRNGWVELLPILPDGTIICNCG